MSAQITLEERYAIMGLKKARLSIRAIARELGRAPSTISRELSRNVRPTGHYTPKVAHSYAVARRRRSRRNTHFSADEWTLVEHLISLDWSPEQVSGWLKLHGILSISHETIYLRVWRDKQCGGELWRHLRQALKRRKRHHGHERRGRLAGKRHISERPAEVEGRTTVGHWEIDTVKGDSQACHSVVTMVERATGYTMIGKLERHSECRVSASEKAVQVGPGRGKSRDGEYQCSHTEHRVERVLSPQTDLFAQSDQPETASPEPSLDSRRESFVLSNVFALDLQDEAEWPRLVEHSSRGSSCQCGSAG